MADATPFIKVCVDIELSQALKLYRYKTGISASQVVRDALYAFPLMTEYLEEVKRENAAKEKK